METKNQQHENTLNCYRMPPTGNYVNLFVHTAKINIIVMGISYSSEDCFFSYTKIHKRQCEGNGRIQQGNGKNTMT